MTFVFSYALIHYSQPGLLSKFLTNYEDTSGFFSIRDLSTFDPLIYYTTKFNSGISVTSTTAECNIGTKLLNSKWRGGTE